MTVQVMQSVVSKASFVVSLLALWVDKPAHAAFFIGMAVYFLLRSKED